MVRRLVEQQEIVVGAEQTRQAHPVPLPDGEVVQSAGGIGFGVERFQRDLHPPFGVPRIEDFGVLQSGGISLLRSGDARRE